MGRWDSLITAPYDSHAPPLGWLLFRSYSFHQPSDSEKIRLCSDFERQGSCLGGALDLGPAGDFPVRKEAKEYQKGGGIYQDL